MPSGGAAWVSLLVAVCLSTAPAIQTATESTDVSTTTTTTTIVKEAARNGGERYCNETVSYSVKTDCRPCQLNVELGCPDGLVQLTQVLPHSHCSRNCTIVTIRYEMLF